jgi:signal transduction histidine kinase
MFPLRHGSRLQALLGFLVRPQEEPPTAALLEMLRRLSHISGPFLGVLCDMQTLRRKSEELEAVVHIKTHFLSNLCHEIRSLLGAVQGYSRRIIDGRAGVINDLQRDHLTVVLRNTNKLLDLVSHSLPFVAEQQLRVGSLDLRLIWQAVLKRARSRRSETSGKIIEQVSPEPLMVTADKDKLAAVLEMLIANALQCADKAGEVTAQFLRGVNGDVTVRLFAPGRGLPPELVDRIFEHHNKLDPGAADSGNSRVTGLSLVHDMIWLHGGRISVTSNPGEGTVFTFTLPPPLPAQEAET